MSSEKASNQSQVVLFRLLGLALSTSAKHQFHKMFRGIRIRQETAVLTKFETYIVIFSFKGKKAFACGDTFGRRNHVNAP